VNLADANRRAFGHHHHTLATAPVFIIAVVIVRYLRDTLEVDGERGQQARQ
jgi:hypothetical protein